MYYQELDLLVEASNADVAACGLFWPDPVTGVGVVEPMRTEAAYQRLGLARHHLTAGLAWLAVHGCVRFDVTYKNDNPAARNLYLGVGFMPTAGCRIYRRRSLDQADARSRMR